VASVVGRASLRVGLGVAGLVELSSSADTSGGAVVVTLASATSLKSMRSTHSDTTGVTRVVVALVALAQTRGSTGPDACQAGRSLLVRAVVVVHMPLLAMLNVAGSDDAGQAGRALRVRALLVRAVVVVDVSVLAVLNVTDSDSSGGALLKRLPSSRARLARNECVALVESHVVYWGGRGGGMCQ